MLHLQGDLVSSPRVFLRKRCAEKQPVRVSLTYTVYLCVPLSEREGEEGAPGGSEGKTEGSHLPAEDAAGRPGALRLSGGQLRLAAAVCRHGEAEGEEVQTCFASFSIVLTPL